MDNDERVGIVTLVGSYNYGNRLQNYATSEIYRAAGYAVETLILNRPPKPVRIAKNLLKTFLRVSGEQHTDVVNNTDRLEAFMRFNSLMDFHEIKSFQENFLNRYRWFSVGSDQTWNPHAFAENADWFFLKFAEPDRRIALAPSIGLDCLSRHQSNSLLKGIEGFSSLSIRERRGAEIIMSVSGRESTVLIDPTLMLSVQQWLTVADDRLTPKEPYILAYVLGDEMKQDDEIYDLVSLDSSLKIIRLSDRNRQGEIPAGPAEFISLIAHATHVVTDSYHASVFSMIFETPMTIIKREGGRSMSSRIEELCSLFGLSDKLYGSSEYNPSLSSNYSRCMDVLETERLRFKEYLERCLLQ